MKKKEKGAALVWVICISLVLMILGSTLLDITLANARQAANYADKNQASFLARSGVDIGLKMLQQKLYDSNDGEAAYADRTALINALNAQAGDRDFVVDGAGSFRLRFQDLSDGTGNMKIIGVGKSDGANGTEDTVTLTLKLSMGSSSNIIENPSDWFSSNGNSLKNMNSQKILRHKVPADTKYIGKMVMLNGGVKPVKYPQGGGEDAESVFRASVIAFKCYKDGIACFSQDSNKLNVTFDAEIIYFGGNVESRGNDIRIMASQEVLDRPNNGMLRPADNNDMGFNDLQRYLSFVQSYNNSMTADAMKKYWGKYNFDSSYQYGIVCFKKDVDGIKNGCYFFPSDGINGLSIIHQEDRGNVLGYNRLIRINEDDPVIDTLEAMYNNTGNISVLYWDNK